MFQTESQTDSLLPLGRGLQPFVTEGFLKVEELYEGLLIVKMIFLYKICLYLPTKIGLFKIIDVFIYSKH